MFEGNTDPYPYILAAYCLGAVGFFGTTAWIYRQRVHVRALLRGIRGETGENGK